MASTMGVQYQIGVGIVSIHIFTLLKQILKFSASSSFFVSILSFVVSEIDSFEKYFF